MLALLNCFPLYPSIFFHSASVKSANLLIPTFDVEFAGWAANLAKVFLNYADLNSYSDLDPYTFPYFAMKCINW
jgi:Mlc titration factor MtfA (ptsG expression regulator)